MKDFFSFALFLLIPVYSSAQDVCACHVVVPGYPPLARMARIDGSVNVEIEIGPEGNVITAKASGSHKLLQRESEDNIRLWKFCPTRTSAGPSRNLIRITYVYKLEGKEAYHAPFPKVTLDLPFRVEIISSPPEPQP